MDINIPTFINKNIFYELLLLGKEDSEFFKNIIEMYLVQAFDIIDQLHNFINIKKIEECSKLSHKLKGSSSTLGLKDVTLCCEKIEYLGKICELQNEIFIEIKNEIKILENNLKVAKEFLLQFI